jgi:hypothetical protein
MATLGLVLLWFGYTSVIGGLAKIKSAYGNSPALTISDLALPSHRGTYIAAVSAWGTGSTGAASPGSTGAPSPIPAPSGPLQGPVAAGATGAATLGRTPPPSPVAVPSGPFTP